MADQDNVWYRLGYTLERARDQAPGWDRLRSFRERRTDPKVASSRPSRPESPARGDAIGGETWDAFAGALTTLVAGKLLDALPKRRRPGPIHVLRAGVAGAAAALLREALRPLISGESRGRPIAEAAREAAVAGGARGLLYGALVEPRLPGPPLLQGLAYGGLEYLVSPWGGLTELAGVRAPHRSLPFVADLFQDFEPGDDTLADHLVFGTALAVLAGAAGSGSDEDGKDRE